MSSEQDPLLHTSHERGALPPPSRLDRAIARVPKVAFLVYFGMNAAAASSIFAFAHILCGDAVACKEHERTAFSRAILVASSISSVVSALAIGPLNLIAKKKPKFTLLLWVAIRGASVGLLWFAAAFRSLWLAIASKTVEGAANDNMLQYALATVYARASSKDRFSSLMAESMAFTLLGSSTGPLFAGLGKDFNARFLLAICTYLLAAIYVGRLVDTSSPVEQQSDEEHQKEPWSGRIVARAFAHLSVFRTDPQLLAPALALLVYTMGQGYLFPALMVDTSIRFHFTDRENGWLLSLATATSALTAFAVRFLQKKTAGRTSARTFNFVIALLSASLLSASLPLLSIARLPWQVYLVTSVLSFGLLSSSFVKAYGVLLLGAAEDGPPALAMFETVGGLLSPAIVGMAQVRFGPGMYCFVSLAFTSTTIMILAVSGCAQFLKGKGRKETLGGENCP